MVPGPSLNTHGAGTFSHIFLRQHHTLSYKVFETFIYLLTYIHIKRAPLPSKKEVIQCEHTAELTLFRGCTDAFLKPHAEALNP